MTPASTARLERFFLAAAKAAEVELRHLAHASADAGEVAARALHDADEQLHLTRDEQVRAHSALTRWQSADPAATELPAIFRTVAALFAESIVARRMAELETSRAEDANAQRRQSISAAQRVQAPTSTVH